MIGAHDCCSTRGDGAGDGERCSIYAMYRSDALSSWGNVQVSDTKLETAFEGLRAIVPQPSAKPVIALLRFLISFCFVEHTSATPQQTWHDAAPLAPSKRQCTRQVPSAALPAQTSAQPQRVAESTKCSTTASTSKASPAATI